MINWPDWHLATKKARKRIFLKSKTFIRCFSVESLLETAEHLSATASLLDSAQLDHIEGRLSALLQNLDTVKEKKEKLTDDPEKDKMVGIFKIYFYN